MEITTRIDPEKIDLYAKRIAYSKIKIAGIVFGFFVLFFMIILDFSSFSLIFLFVFGAMFGLIYLVSINGASNIANVIEIIINDNAVIFHHSKQDLDGFTNLGMELSEMRFGTKFDKVFPFSKIESTEIREKEIAIFSSDFAFFDDNNVIRIPCECSKYEEIVDVIKSNSKKFKLIHDSI